MTVTAPISVVIPSFNSEGFLRETIASVRAQTLAPAEIIVVDDGSRDASAALATELGAHVIHRANGGICAARNTGIAAASQPWIALLDHDDWWHPSKLARQWAAVERFPAAVLVATDCAKVGNDGQPVEASMAHRPISRYEVVRAGDRDGTMILHEHAAEDLAWTGWFLLPSAALVRRDILLATGGFDERLRRWEDVDCFLRVLLHGPLVFIDEVLMYWVQHATNSSADYTAMRRGLLALYDLVRRQPSAYPRSLLERLERERGPTLLELARTALDDPHVGNATALAAAAFRAAPSRRALLVFAASFLPRPLLQRVSSARVNKAVSAAP